MNGGTGVPDRVAHALNAALVDEWSPTHRCC